MPGQRRDWWLINAPYCVVVALAIGALWVLPGIRGSRAGEDSQARKDA